MIREWAPIGYSVGHQNLSPVDIYRMDLETAWPNNKNSVISKEWFFDKISDCIQ